MKLSEKGEAKTLYRYHLNKKGKKHLNIFRNKYLFLYRISLQGQKNEIVRIVNSIGIRKESERLEGSILLTVCFYNF